MPWIAATGQTVVPDSTATGSEQKLGVVEVRAQRLPVRVTADVPIQTINGVRMQELGIVNMADAVRRFAGTTIRDYGGIGGLKTVSVRNMGAAHTAVSYDGAPVSNCQGGQIDIGKFSLDNVSTLSLAVGQPDDMMQPARLYASGAVLSITTLSPDNNLEGRNYSLEGQVRGGAWGYVNPMVRWQQRVTQKVTLSLDGDYMRADGNYPFTLVNGNEVTKEKRNNSEIDSWHGEGNIYVNFNENQKLQVKGYYYQSKRGLPGAVTLYNPLSTETLRDKDVFAQARWQGQFGAKWKMQAIGKYTYGWTRDKELSSKYEGGVYEDTHRQKEFYGTVTALYTPLMPLQIALAQDVIVNKLWSTTSNCPFPTRYSSITAFSGRWQQRALTINATLTASNIYEQVKSGKKPKDVSRLNPTVAISVQPVKSEMLYVRAMFKNTFRMPTFNDLYYDRVGTRTLKPESAYEYNVGITWSRRGIGVLDYLAVTADGYLNDVTNKIVALPSTYTWRMINFGKAQVKGIDVTFATGVTLPAEMNLALTAAYTFQKAINLSDPSSKNYKEQLPYTPVHTGNVAMTLNTRWVNLGYSAVGVGKRYYLAQNIPANEIKGYVEQTISASRELKLKACTLTLRGEIINLGNVQYEVIKFYPMPGRSWRVTLGIKI